MPKKSSRRRNPDEDAELIEAIDAGHQDQYYDQVKRYERKRYNFGLRVCRNAHDAADHVQETFLNVLSI